MKTLDLNAIRVEMLSVIFLMVATQAKPYTAAMRQTLTPNARHEYDKALKRSKAQEGSAEDCAMRRLALSFAQSLQPQHSPHRGVFDALQLGVLCGDQPPPAHYTSPSFFSPPPTSTQTSRGSVVYVAATGGDDTGQGSEDQPFASIHAAQAHARSLPAPRTIVLRGGVHFLNKTLQLTPIDRGLIIRSAAGEHAWLSGGKPLPTKLPWKQISDKGIWRVKLPEDFGPVTGLHALAVDGTTKPQVRARHPNRRPMDGTMEHGLWSPQNSTWSKHEPWANSARTVWLRTPNDTAHHSGECGTHFTYGVGGPCERFSPPGGYLCSANASGGGFGWEEEVPGAPLFPIGLRVPDSAWQQAGIEAPSEWMTAQASGTSAVLETWTNGWATTFWEVEASGETLHFTRGGQQIGRGFHTANNDPHNPIYDVGPWKIENALELLDAPEEWFFSPTDHTLTLFLNASGSPAATGLTFVVPQLKQLVTVKGTMDQPVVNVSLVGIGFRDAAYTYLDEWGVPSGGDWALHRGGAVFVEGATGFLAQSCTFEHLQTNALFLSGFTRAASIRNSSFAHIGESAVALWGFTRDTEGAPDGRLPAGVGIDGDGGEQPRGTTFAGNLVHDIGLTERQSSAFGEFKACESLVLDNIVYNIPRAAINFVSWAAIEPMCHIQLHRMRSAWPVRAHVSLLTN